MTSAIRLFLTAGFAAVSFCALPAFAQSAPPTFVVSCQPGSKPALVLEVKDAPIVSKEYPEGSKIVRLQSESSVFWKVLPPSEQPSSLKPGIEMCVPDLARSQAKEERPAPRVQRTVVTVGFA